MLQNNKTRKHSGFTLVEMLIVVPIALLVITGFVALMVTMVGDVIASRTYNVMTYDIESALDTIERDVKLSTQFQTTSGAMLSPQGEDGGTSAFTSTSNDLILGEIATDKNPIDPSRGLVYYNSPFGCNNSETYKNRLFFITVVYFERGGSLWRRTYVPNASNLCQSVWPVNTCAPGYTNTTQCKTTDSEILKGVTSFNPDYFVNPQDTVAISDASATSASSIRVSIQTQTTSAGRTVSTSSSGRFTKLSSKDINLPPPASPSVSGSASGNEANFSWPGVPTATSYYVRYNVNGGSWVTAAENTTDNSLKVAARRGDTVSIKVQARNTTGTSAEANASVTIPVWTPCSFQNGWANYGSVYAPCGYTITDHGVVMLRGLVRSGTLSSVIFNIPAGYRPGHRLIFQASVNPNVHTRINVDANGNVSNSESAAGATNGYLSLDGISFIPVGTLYTWNTLTPINGWTNYDTGGHATLESLTDASGRVHTKGLLLKNSAASWSDVTNMAAGTAPTKVHIFPARASNGVNAIGMRPNGTMMDRGIAQSWYSIQTMHYAAGYTGWQNFTHVAGNPTDGQMGNGWVWYNDYGAIHEPPQYTKGADGIVTIKGMIRSGASGGGVQIANLPAGYLPEGRLIFNVITQTGFGQVDIDANGLITVRSGISSSWTSLDGIHFLAHP